MLNMRLAAPAAAFDSPDVIRDYAIGEFAITEKGEGTEARIVEPRQLLVVDEPSKGLAPAIINNMIDAFAQLKKTGTTILLVEQNISFAKRLGDHVAVMDDGRVVHAGSMQALAENEDLQRSLLGLSI